MCAVSVCRFSFASGAEEKVLRVFQAPRNFLDNFCKLCGVDLSPKVSVWLEFRAKNENK